MLLIAADDVLFANSNFSHHCDGRKTKPQVFLSKIFVFSTHFKDKMPYKHH